MRPTPPSYPFTPGPGLPRRHHRRALTSALAAPSRTVAQPGQSQRRDPWGSRLLAPLLVLGPQLGVWPCLDALLLPILEPQALGSAPPAAADTRPLRPDCFCSHRLCSVSQISPPHPWEAFGFLLSSRLAGSSFERTVENEVCSDLFGAFLLCWRFRAVAGVEAPGRLQRPNSAGAADPRRCLQPQGPE